MARHAWGPRGDVDAVELRGRKDTAEAAVIGLAVDENGLAGFVRGGLAIGVGGAKCGLDLHIVCEACAVVRGPNHASQALAQAIFRCRLAYLVEVDLVLRRGFGVLIGGLALIGTRRTGPSGGRRSGRGVFGGSVEVGRK